MIERVIPDTKSCSNCREDLPADAFRPNHRMRSGLDSWCRSCNSARNARWRAAHPERTAEHAANRKPRSTMERRIVGLWVNYRMTWDDYVALIDLQNGTCAICGTSDPGFNRSTFAVDHNHETGAVRGLLCHACNLAIGQFRDNPKTIRAAADYLEARTWTSDSQR